MARKINKKLVGGLIVVCMVLTMALSIVALVTLPGQNPEKYAKEARELAEKGEHDRAMKTFRRAYARDSAKNPEYLVEAAECALVLGEPREARKLIATARRQESTLRSALEFELGLEFELARMLDSNVQWNKVLKLGETMLGNEETSELPLVHHGLGLAYLKLKGEDTSFAAKGKASLEHAYELDPGGLEVVKSLTNQLWTRARKLEATGKTQEAAEVNAKRESILATAIERCKESGDEEKEKELLFVKIRFDIIDGDIENGLKALEDLSTGENPPKESFLLLGRIMLGGFVKDVPTDLPAAQKYLELGLEVDPENGNYYVLLGRIYEAQRGQSQDDAEKQKLFQEKQEVLKLGLENVENSKHFRKLPNTAYRNLFFEDLFLQQLNRSRSMKDAAAKEEVLAEAESWMEELEKERGTEAAIVRLLRARLLNARGDYIQATREAEAAKDRATSRTLNNLERLLTDLYMAQGQWGKAQDSIQALLNSGQRDPRLFISFARIKLQLKEPAQALRLLQAKSPPLLASALANDRGAIRLRMEAYRRLDQPELAAAENEKLGQDSPQDELRGIAVKLWDERHAEAEADLKDFLTRHPENEGGNTMLLSLYRDTDRLDDARSLLDTLIDQFPDNRRYQQYKLILASDTESEDYSAQVLDFLEQEEDEFDRYMGIARFHILSGHLDQAGESLDKAEQIKPDAESVVKQQFQLTLRRKDWDRAEVYIEKDRQKNSDGTRGKLAEGRLAMARGLQEREEGREQEATEFFETAIELFNIAVDRYPSNSSAWTTLARAHRFAGQNERARQVLNRALKINPQNGMALRLLAKIAAEEGDDAQELPLLEKAVQSLPDDPWVKGRLLYHAEKADPASGIESREQRLTDKPDDVDNLVSLARLHADPAVANYERAEELYRLAIKLKPENLSLTREVADFLGSEEVNLPAEGEQLLKHALNDTEDMTRKARIATSLGRFHENQNALATADRYYRMAVSFHASGRILALCAEFYARTNRFKEALEYFERVVETADAEPDLVHRTEARMIAILLMIGDLDEARIKIDNFVDQYPEDPTGIIYEGAWHRVGGDVQMAEKAFNSHLEIDPDNAIALWQRGQLHLLRGRWQQAIDDLEKVKGLKPDSFGYQHRISLADALLQSGKGDAAIRELRLVINEDPDAVAVVEALVDTLAKVRPPRFSEAETLIVQYMRRFPRDPRWPALLGDLGKASGNNKTVMRGYEKAAEVSKYNMEYVREFFRACRKDNLADRIMQFATENLSEQLLDRDAEVLALLAWAYGAKGDMNRCTQTFDRALQAASKNFRSYTYVAREMVNAFGAEKSLERALEQTQADPENIEKLRALVHLYVMNSKTEEAIATADRILEYAVIDDDKLFGNLAKGMLMKLQGEYDGSRAAYEEALKLDPNQAMALNNLAYLLCDVLKRPAEALPYAKAASRVSPNDANVLDTYGWTLILNNKLGEGIGTLLRALEISRNNYHVLHHLGIAYGKQGDTAEAIARLRQARDRVNEMIDAWPKDQPKEGATKQAEEDLLPKIEEALRDLE